MTRIRKLAVLEKIWALTAPFLAIGFLSVILPHSARADVVIPVVRIDCMPELGILSVAEDTLNGNRAMRSLLDQPEEVAAKYGYHNISAYFIIEDSKEAGKDPRIVGRRTAHFECQLAGHKVDISFVPIIAKPCSAAVAIALTIQVNGTTLLDDLDFYKTCLRGDVISTFRFDEDGEFVTIHGGADKTRNPVENGGPFPFTVVYQFGELSGEPLQTFERLFADYERKKQ